MGSNVERLRDRWRDDGIGQGEWNTQSIVRAITEAIEADREEGIEVTVEHDMAGAFVYLSEGGGTPEPGPYTLIKREAGDSEEEA